MRANNHIGRETGPRTNKGWRRILKIKQMYVPFPSLRHIRDEAHLAQESVLVDSPGWGLSIMEAK